MRHIYHINSCVFFSVIHLVYFYCNDGERIFRNQTCDGYWHCAGAEDEMQNCGQCRRLFIKSDVKDAGAGGEVLL